MFCVKCGSRIENGARYCAVCGNRIGDSPMPVNDPDAKSISVLKRKESRGRAMSFTMVKVLSLVLLLNGIFMPLIGTWSGSPGILESVVGMLAGREFGGIQPYAFKVTAVLFSLILGIASLAENKPASIICSGLGLLVQASIMYSHLGDTFAITMVFGIGGVSIFAFASVVLFLWAFIASCGIVSNEVSKDEIKDIARKARIEKGETK